MDAKEHETRHSDWAPTERISWFPVPDEEDLDPRVADLVARQREKLGAPNNVVRTHAWRPELMLRWLDFYEYISKGPSGLSRVEREMDRGRRQRREPLPLLTDQPRRRVAAPNRGPGPLRAYRARLP